jgi:hypothetical protein
MYLTILLTLVTPAVGADIQPRPHAAGLHDSIRLLRQTGPGGRGSTAAAPAWRQVAAADLGRLPEILAGMDGANAVACNWLRSAIDEVLDRTRAGKHPLPVRQLEAFLRDRRHHPAARRLAFELLVEADKGAAERLLPGMIDDPSPELRQDAVARLLDRADKLSAGGKKEQARTLLRRAFAAAREREQIARAAQGLRGLSEKIDLARHLGMVLDWRLIGPFPNVRQQGAQTRYPPERGIDLDAAYDGKAGKVRWTDYLSRHEYGLVDLNAALGQHMPAVAYAYTTLTSARRRDGEVRIGCYTAFKLWVNGELVLDRGDAYTGMELDHYVGKVRLRPGKNTILLKVDQDEIPAGVPRLWQFQLRVCDEDGVAILSTTRKS